MQLLLSSMLSGEYFDYKRKRHRSRNLNKRYVKQDTFVEAH